MLMYGVCQVVPDATSLHHLREKWVELKWAPGEQNLHSYFVKAYGPEHLAPFKVLSHTTPPTHTYTPTYTLDTALIRP